MIRFNAIHAGYPNHTEDILHGVTLEVPEKKTLVLLGGSGSGKSTLLKCLLRLLPLRFGSITLDGENIRTLDRVALRRRIGMVFQGIALFPHMTVGENVGLVLRLMGGSKRANARRVEEMLELVGLPPREFLHRYPHTLSGGQQQRVGVARALATNPSYLLMDEPFGALDAITRRRLQEEIKQLRQTLDITILFVTHDIAEAVMLGDRLAVMQNGHILQTGSVRELMEQPVDATVRDLVATPLQQMQLDLANGTVA